MKMKISFITLVGAAVTALALSVSSCEHGNPKSQIADAVKARVERELADGETYRFIGLFNPHDTLFMGVQRRYAGVIYTVGDASGRCTRHCVDVILSEDYSEVLSLNDAAFDPVEYAEKAVKSELKKRLKEMCK